ncbi:phospholipid/cholesterol/gamma-HCH transport system substrate-binding protein [Actinocorallia herbida]|uniref:Phospholipid/cholesterol/gamma-HCH transport system substrate-binding protein n=1 Tax=Actinocorallia herbida TaxID=58109 RepID=A0A3N1D3X0_9ACTN|nr:MlaD family protein [Actinocorallia herbida]ROO88234.1 phospholipid/cholesterol/gamma-HCH transport system substrate-binding protein [Actinocorallia herbida]
MALKSFRDRSPITVGLVSLLAVGTAIAVTFAVGTMGLLKKQYSMSGIFADTGGLRDGNNVLVAGVLVGEITGVEPDFRAGHVLVTWKVDSGVDLGPETRAEIRMTNILGGRYLRLTGPVSDFGPYLEDKDEDARRIPIERTQIPTTVNDVLQVGTETLKELDAETFGKVLDEIGGLPKKTRTELADALGNLADIAEELEGDDVKIGELLDNSQQIIGTVREKEHTLSNLVDNVMTLISTLRQRRTQLTLLLGSGSDTVKSLDTLIEGQQKDLISVIGDLNKTTGAIDPRMKDLNTALAWAGPALTAFSNSGNTGNWVDTIFTQIGQLSPGDLAKFNAKMKEARK